MKDGWLAAPYSGPEPAAVEMSFGGVWHPAFLDMIDGKRYAVLRPPTQLMEGIEVQVHLRALGQVYG